MAKLSKVDAAKAAGMSRQTLYTYIKDGRLSVDADGLIDTAELLRAGFTLHPGHEIGRQALDTTGHDWTSKSAHAGRLLGHDHHAQAAAQRSPGTGAGRFRARNGRRGTGKTCCSTMLQDMQHRL